MRLRQCIMLMAIAATTATAFANTNVWYAGETNTFGVQILDADLQPDLTRAGDDEHRHIAVVAHAKDGTGGVLPGWTVALERVPDDTEGNYVVSVAVPAGMDATYSSVSVSMRLDDTGWGVKRDWVLAPGRWMQAAQYTPPPAATVIAGAVAAQITPAPAATVVAGAVAALITPPPSATVIAGTVDTVMTASHGAGQWGALFGGSNVVNITCQTAAATPVAIPGATVQIRGPETGSLVYYGVTSADGRIAVNLDAGDYSIYAFKIGQYSFTNPTELTVDEDPETVVLTGTEFSPATPADPDICMVYGWARDAHGNLQPNAAVKVTFSSNYGTYGNNQIVKKTWTGTADASAYWEMPCIANSVIYPAGTSYQFEIGTFKYAGVEVPAGVASIPLETLLRGTPTPTATPTRTPTPTPTATP